MNKNLHGDILLEDSSMAVYDHGTLVCIHKKNGEYWGRCVLKREEESLANKEIIDDDKRVGISFGVIHTFPIQAPNGKIYHSNPNEKPELINLIEAPEDIREMFK